MQCRLLSIVIVFLAVGAWQPCPSPAADRPNIVLILVDDMGWSNIGCYGGMVETPHLDQLARQGVRFTHFYNSARCCPTRAALMTGLHPHQVGVGHMALPIRERQASKPGQHRAYHALTSSQRADVPRAYQGWMDETVTTLPEMLKSAGYATYMTGKWHLASEQQTTWPLQRGFDRFYGHLSGVSDFFDPANLYRGNEPIAADGKEYYLTDAVSEEAIKMLADHERQDDDQPFFLYLAYNAPHYPIQCMPAEYEKYRGRYREGWDLLREQRLARQKEMGLVPDNTTLAPRPQEIPAWDTLDPQRQTEMDAIMATYAGMIDRIDQNIGRLQQHLVDTGELDNTLFFFLSDNGAEAESGPFGQFEFATLGRYGTGGFKYGKGWATVSNTPFREYKRRTYQGGIQTPLIVHWPAGIKNQATNQILKQPGYVTDIVETCLDVARYKAPDQTPHAAQETQGREGVSLLKTLQGETGPIHVSPICIEHEGHRTVRQGRWKLVAYFNKPWQLFDIEQDMSEQRDIATEHPEVVAELAAAYAAWAERSGVIPWQQAKAYNVYNRPKLKLKFQDNFEQGTDRWEILDPNTWKLTKRNDNHSLAIVARDSDYQPPVRSPQHVALITDLEVGDFELVFRVRSTKDTGDHRDCCVFFGYQDDRHFYYAHLGAKPDPASGQILIVNDAPRMPLTKNRRATPWDDQWHKVKVVRRLHDGTIKVFFDDMKKPHMSVKDLTFGPGRIGIGSFDDLNEFDDIQLRTN
jgi:arylsulfatase